MIMKSLMLFMIALFPLMAWADPAIEFRAEQCDFGSVAQGGILEHAFEFRNAGTDDLIIKEVNAS
jgi:hypothetical protein